MKIAMMSLQVLVNDGVRGTITEDRILSGIVPELATRRGQNFRATRQIERQDPLKEAVEDRGATLARSKVPASVATVGRY
jgi:hypothetical protein